jgi:hypothetical protein
MVAICRNKLFKFIISGDILRNYSISEEILTEEIESWRRRLKVIEMLP